jgi:hypothetical protein
MPTTTNFGWTTPADTDLVKDGAAAIRTLGSNIDTSLVDLKGGTTGQYLQKNSGTDLDYVWADVSAGGMTLISTTTLSGATTTLSSIPQTYTSLYLIVTGITTENTTNKQIRILPNNDNNLVTSNVIRNQSAGGVELAVQQNSLISLTSGENLLRTDNLNSWVIKIDNYASTTSYKLFNLNGSFITSGSYRSSPIIGGVYLSNSAITSLVFDAEGVNTFTTGTVLLYGVK